MVLIYAHVYLSFVHNFLGKKAALIIMTDGEPSDGDIVGEGVEDVTAISLTVANLQHISTFRFGAFASNAVAIVTQILSL